MRRFTLGVGAFVIALCIAGCFKRKDETPPKITNLSANQAKIDIDQNKVFRVAWDYDEDDGDISLWPANLYAKANFEVRKIMRQMFPNDDYRDLEVHIVPHFQGYRIVVLSRRKLTNDEQDQIHGATLAAVGEAHEKWVTTVETNSHEKKDVLSGKK